MALFTPDDAALLRMPAAPVAMADATRVGLADAGQVLRTVLDDPVLRETVELSSTALAGTLQAVDAGRTSQSKVDRAGRSAARYLLRMAGRPTPFGLHSGVAVAAVDDTTKVRIGTAHRKGVRVDSGWLTALLVRFERDPRVLRKLRVVANDLFFTRGDRLVLPYVPSDASESVRSVRELSVRRTPPASLALEIARQPIPFTGLVAEVAAAFPRASTDAVERMLGQLVAQDLLLTDLHPPLVDTDQLDHVIDHLAGLPEAAALRHARELLAAYAEAPIGQGLPQWNRAVEALQAIQPGNRAPIQVDLRVDADVRLPRAVADQAARAAEVLYRFGLTRQEPPHLTDYREAFLDRYGSHQLVPLAELIDPERGLGAPAGYRVPDSERRLRHSVTPSTPVDDALAALAQQVMLSGEVEFVLDDALVDRLAPTHPDDPAPDSAELCVRVLASSAAALDAGDFRLVVARSVGAPNAGEMFSRFAYLFDNRPISATPDQPNLLPVQLVFRPLHGRMGNLLQVPAVCERTLAIGTFAERGREDVLGLADLSVGIDGERLFLAAPALGAEILAVSPHRMNTTHSTANVVRLIREITAARHNALDAWSWGATAGRLPMQPRVRYGRTVLSAATWTVSDRMRDKNLPWAEWNGELDAWRARWRVPERVQAIDRDVCLELDLTSELHRRLLRDELSRRPDTVVGEVCGGPEDTGWLDGYAAEFVVPLRGVGPRPASARVVAQPPPSRRLLPGGEWLYAKLYAATTRHDELLAQHVAPLVAGQRWFFIRYADPDPHLRLRFHAPADRLLPELHAWAAGLCDSGLASRLVIDSYEPETARYGGPALLPAAELVFRADSESVLDQLRLPSLPLSPVMLAAANYLDMLSAFGDPDWLLDNHPKDIQQHRAFRAVRTEAVTLLDPASGWRALAARPGGDVIVSSWARRRVALAAYGEAVRAAGSPHDSLLPALLHMHHNRLIGFDPTSEAESLALARGAVEAHRNRARFGR
ncbi:lantibiotic dehydratase [Actinocrispum wychmicini]|uniref:Thiopeptide-type bacteriocin biosynthesis protein n=1 Tax=Actinocrispum wychmicini TaxID=1213861 RepID=A0A4R2JT98_9PSEU|nr:lantibiotic dehydratase [Actinocrispum wychmicini]TCO62192.1 thiopeptide-type bacteriocin biosynthesis protein [Actinocrispum wychmicini]